MITQRACALAIAALAACGGTYPKGKTTPAVTGDPAVKRDSTVASAGADEPEEAEDPDLVLPPGGIAASALPYDILDARTGHQVDEATFWSRLAAARAVCVGEEHPNPHHHWVQLHVVQELLSRYPKSERMGLGLEMIQRPFQGVVDDYVSHRIDAAAFTSRIGWEDRWGYNFELYHPTLDAAIAGGGTVLALNASRELTKKVSHHGLESLSADERAQVPQLKLDDPRHRAWFDALMDSMGGGAAHSAHAPASTSAADAAASPHGDLPEMPSAERIYTVQVLWDETMADTGAKWLAANPTGHLVILAGTGHCHDSAIVGRLARRAVPSPLSIRAVIDTEGAVAEALASPMNDFLVVLKRPKP